MNRRPRGVDRSLWSLAKSGHSVLPVRWWRTLSASPSEQGVALQAGAEDTDDTAAVERKPVAGPRDHGTPANDGEDEVRRKALVAARAGLVGALDLLDLHSRSPAAANVDLAIHQIDQELGR